MTMVSTLARSLYRHLPADVSTRLACSKFGRMIYRRHKERRIYQCDYGIRLSLTGDEAVSLGIASLGCVHPVETELIAKVFPVDGVMIDVGASYDGWHALVCAAIGGKNATVIAFEPIPSSCTRLEDHVRDNSLRLAVVEAAVSDHSGILSFNVLGCNSHAAENGTLNVRCVTLDEAAPSGIIDVLKIDAEGHEPQVLAGGSDTLRRTRYILLEVCEDYHAREGTDSRDVVTTLRDIGFRAYSLFPDGSMRTWTKGARGALLNVWFVNQKI